MQKIHDDRLKTFDIVIAIFVVDNKDRKSWFLEETFLLVNINIDIVFRIFFFNLNNIEINFIDQKLKKRLYHTAKTLSTSRWVKLVRKKEFIVVAFNLDNKIFIVYIAFFTNINLGLEVYLFCKA